MVFMFIWIARLTIHNIGAVFSSAIFFLSLKTSEQYLSSLYSSYLSVQLFQQEIFELTKF